MKQISEKVLRKYGFENWRTVLVFKIMELVKR